MLSLSDITSKIRAVAMIITFDVQRIFHKSYLGIIVICFRTKFYMLSSSGSLVIIIKLIVQEHAFILHSVNNSHFKDCIPSN
jgi:hypothetical protein